MPEGSSTVPVLWSQSAAHRRGTMHLPGMAGDDAGQYLQAVNLNQHQFPLLVRAPWKCPQELLCPQNVWPLTSSKTVISNYHQTGITFYLVAGKAGSIMPPRGTGISWLREHFWLLGLPNIFLADRKCFSGFTILSFPLSKRISTGHCHTSSWKL